MSSSCADIRDLLPWFVGADLAAADLARVREHLQGCLACRRLAAGGQQAHKALQGLHEPPPGVDDDFFHRLQADVIAKVEAVTSETSIGRRRWPWLVAAAAAFALGYFGFTAASPEARVLHRDRLAVPTGEPARVVPWSGARVELQPLGHEGPVEALPVGSGMSGRWQLRTLEDDAPAVRPGDRLPGDWGPGEWGPGGASLPVRGASAPGSSGR